VADSRFGVSQLVNCGADSSAQEVIQAIDSSKNSARSHFQIYFENGYFRRLFFNESLKIDLLEIDS
jgi:hypothetical protein